jgi:hypothetical protein
MKNYLALIRRADFIDFFKFGFFYLNSEKVVEFNCPISELPKRDDIYDALFARINSFESSFAYMIINFTKANDADDPSFVIITEVKHIFPLDSEAKKEYESSFDEHVKIDDPIWPDAISLIKKRQLYQSSMQGVRNIFNIFKLEGLEKCKGLISEDTVEEMLSNVYDDIRPSGDVSLWVYLMRYERHSFYPKESLGYFMDIVHIIVNFMSKKEVEDYIVESTDIYKTLTTYEGKGLKSNDILRLLKQNEMASGFLTKIASFVPEVDFILVGVNYLKMRDLYKDEFTYNEEFISACKASFGESFTIASYMIGIALGHNKTYACLYELLPLDIYKSKEEMAAILRQKQEERERAKREMERIERERERERRKKSKKKGKKDTEYNHFGQPGYSQGRGGYSTWGRQSEELFSPYQGDDQGYIPSSMGRGYKNEKPKQEPQTNKGVSHVDSNNETENLFGIEEIQSMEYQTRNLISFPLKLQKYTKSGKPSTAKNSTAIVNNKEEYENFKNTHSGETWKLKK